MSSAKSNTAPTFMCPVNYNTSSWLITAKYSFVPTIFAIIIFCVKCLSLWLKNVLEWWITFLNEEIFERNDEGERMRESEKKIEDNIILGKGDIKSCERSKRREFGLSQLRRFFSPGRYVNWI